MSDGETQVTATGEPGEDLQAINDGLRARVGELEEQAAQAGQAADAARVASEEAQGAALGHLRRALLAENAGRVVPELIAGSSPEELEASVEGARAVFDRAIEAARTQLGRERVPTGAPTRESGTPAPEALSPVEKIQEGLRTK